VSTTKNRKPFAIAMLVVIAWFLVTGIFGPLFGKLTSVQENNNSSFLPKSTNFLVQTPVFFGQKTYFDREILEQIHKINLFQDLPICMNGMRRKSRLWRGIEV
jgi:flagellar biosynthesis protein FliQ